MSGPQTPEDPSGQEPLRRPGGDAAQAESAVKEVIRWYNSRLFEAQRRPGHDPAEVAGWRQGREEAMGDLERLESADADETVRIALVYAARLKELTGS